jgi:hypothetical protein
VSLTNQHTAVFPVLVTSSLITHSLYAYGRLSVGRVLALITCVLLGLSPYVYLLVRSRWLVIDSWGDQRTLDGFLLHLLRREYGTFQLASSEISTDPGMVSRLLVYALNMRSEMRIMTPCISIIGLLSSLLPSAGRIVRRTSLVLFLSFLSYVLVFHKLANLDLRPLFLGVQARFWQQSNIYVWIWSGMGLRCVVQGVQQGVHAVRARMSRTTAAGGANTRVSSLLSGVYALVFLGYQLSLQYPVHDHHTNISFFTHGESILNSFPPDSIVLLNGDLNNNLVKYPQQCEAQRREDVSLLSLQLMSWDWFVPMQRANYPAVVFPGNRYHIMHEGSFDIRTFLDANIGNPKAKGGVFLCGPHKDGDHSLKRSVNPDTCQRRGAERRRAHHRAGVTRPAIPSCTVTDSCTSDVRRMRAFLTC